MKRIAFQKMSNQFYIFPALGITRTEDHYSLAFGWLCFGGGVIIRNRK